MSETTTLERPAIKVTDNTQSAEISRVFKAQQANRWNVRNTTAAERIKKLKKLKKHIYQNREDIQQAIYADFKKPAPEVDLTETYPAIAEVKTAIANVRSWMKSKPVDTPVSFLGSVSELRYEPKGVCLIISPWNYPFNLGIIPVVGAIASGCTAVLKPSEFTPNTSRLIKKILGEIFDDNEIAVVEGDHTVSQELLKLNFDHVYFTGSPSIGKIVMRAAADHLTSVTLELGGKSPVVIDESANIAEAANKVSWGKFLNCGQTCLAPDYVLVHESKKDEFIEAVKKQIEHFYGKTEEDRCASGDFARIVNARHHKRIGELIHDAIERGAKVEVGGNLKAGENFIAPTVLTNVPEEAKIMQEEIFGPVMPVFAYKTLEEVVRKINSKEKPLALYIFSKKKKSQEYLLQNTSTGGVSINDTILHHSQPNLPFGGVNNSGIGAGHGEWGFKAFSHERAVLKQYVKKGAPQWMYPPYNNFAKKMIDFTLKYF